MENTKKRGDDTLGKMIDSVVLFLIFSVIGVGLEGTYTFLTQGRWETHVVSMIGPFCVIYGFGAVLYFLSEPVLGDKPFVVQLLAFGTIGTVFELFCGLLLLYGLNMRAWDYTHSFLNYKGVICLSMFFGWGLLGVGFCKIVPWCRKVLSVLHRRPFGGLAIVVIAVFILDLFATGFCIYRWKERRDGIPASSRVEQMIDKRYPDAYMQKRFIEWRFLEPAPETAERTAAEPADTNQAMPEPIVTEQPAVKAA